LATSIIDGNINLKTNKGSLATCTHHATDNGNNIIVKKDAKINIEYTSTYNNSIFICNSIKYDTNQPNRLLIEKGAEFSVRKYDEDEATCIFNSNFEVVTTATSSYYYMTLATMKRQDVTISDYVEANLKKIEKEEERLSEQYSTIMSEFDKLVTDSSYQGVNLLTGGELKVTFNESRTHELSVKGKDMRSEKLGVKTKKWNTKGDVKDSIDELLGAVKTMRNFQSELGTNYSIIQTRQNFTDALSDILETGADDLVLADMNETSAEYLMMQTRQQLAVNSLSLASQSASSILSLF
jgi:flagellin-like hook-associated protein FlgL